MGVESVARIRNMTAVLGPTNTGKTHLAIERMLGHETGMIGLPLRLLAREVYDRVCAKVGTEHVALITGEEKIKPETARYWVCTVEAMPQDIAVDFLAIDEIQLAADPERGHVFTDRLLHARGQLETLVLGAATMREAIAELIPEANFISRPRLSKLSYAGQKKITRLPPRTAIVAFSAADVYAIAELIRRQRGGAAVVLGALSPRTRNAQVALYQAGDIDFLVATDAVGMGLNLDVDHVAFSSLRKFDGQTHRNLTPSELAQIAGRAGRHLNDGTFGVTGDAPALEQELIERLEDHNFEPIKMLQWRQRSLDYSTIETLRESLRQLPDKSRLMRARSSDDLEALENVSRDPEIARLASGHAAIQRLWDVCQIPDYRKISSQNHAELVGSVFKFLMGEGGVIDEDWFCRQVAFSDRTDGDIDTLSNRLAHIRTWTFVANRPDWLKDPAHWQQRTREIEDNLSDALHECLAQRFVDARTSALMKGMKDKEQLSAEIHDDGSIHVENHFVGRLEGFRYLPDASAEGLQGKATRNAASQVLAREISMRTRRVVAAKNDAFTVDRVGTLTWRQQAIARLEAGDDPLKPQLTLLADELLQGAERERVNERLQKWISDTVAERLKPLVDIAKAEDIEGLGRGIAFRLTECLGVLRRDEVADQMKALDQSARAQLRRYGVRFGAFNIFFPILLKPAAADLLLTLWFLKSGKEHGLDPANPPEPPRAGLTSAAVDPALPAEFYRAYGFHVCGPRAVRIDMLERLADLIRPLLSWRPNEGNQVPPKGSTGDGGFFVIPEMMSILGCSPEELGNVLNSLGFRSEKRPAPKKEAVLPEVVAIGIERAAADSSSLQAAENGGDAEQDGNVVAGDLASASQPAVTATGDPAASQGGDSISPEPSAEDATILDSRDLATDESAPITHEQEASTPAASENPIEPAFQEPSATGDASADPVAVGEQPADGAPAIAEPEMIEVWRPRRRNDGQNRTRRARGGRGAGNQTEQGEGRPPGDGGQRKEGDSRPGHHRDARADGGGKGRDNDSRRQERDDARQGRGKPRHGKGPKPRRDGERPPQRFAASSVSQRQRAVDPDSPFAALSVLKESMDKKSREN